MSGSKLSERPRGARNLIFRNCWTRAKLWLDNEQTLQIMPTAELTLKLPAEEIEFLKDYAEQHGTTVTDLVAHYVKLLQKVPSRPPHPDNLQFTGVVPADIDVRELYLQHMLEKHR